MMKQDIEGLKEIKILVNVFYDRIRDDQLLSPIFNFRLSSHWEPHLEKMYGFWNSALFGVKGYTGNPFMKHATMEIGDAHFDRWISLFNDVVDNHFEGPVAQDAKRRALIMAKMFQKKLALVKKHHTRPIV